MPFFKKKLIFSDARNREMAEAIREAERMTSGEIRVYIELRCRFVDPMDRAAEIFKKFDIQKTKERNGVLVYVALEDRQFAILGDKGIHEKVGNRYWEKQALILKRAFAEKKYVSGISEAVKSIGESLRKHFPHQDDDQNELPDEIIYG